MILGIGVDMVEIERLNELVAMEHFCKRVYTEREREMAKQRGKQYTSFLAGNFASKEAVSKAFGTGIRGFELNEVEVLRDEKGKPYVNLYKNAKRILEEMHGKRIHISISNTDEHAVSYVVITDDGNI